MSVSAKQQRAATNQAAKVILTELYVRWASEPENAKLLQGKMEEALTAAATPKAASAVAKAGGASSSGAAATAAAAASSSNGKTNRHVDPVTTSKRPVSPPATPPSKNGKGAKPRADETTSPNASQPGQSAAASSGSRMIGVDELDYPHRATSPRLEPTSPQGKPVVDPSAPLPGHHASAGSTSAFAGGSNGTTGTVSPPNVHGVSPVALEPAITTTMVDLMPPEVDLTAAIPKDAPAGRFVHSSGGFAASAPANAKRASVQEIPVFYTKKDSKGVLDSLPTEETQRLRELLSEKEGALAGAKGIRKGVFGDISVQVFQVPIWYKDALFEANAAYVGVGEAAESLTPAQITRFYNEKMGSLTATRRVFELIRSATDKDREYLSMDDLKTMVKYLVASHPGLEFLQQPEFQDYYCRTVAIRIMYALERQQNRKISWRDFDRSDLPDVMVELDSTDVNQVLKYFSYEHFYVLYCKFWELDTDRDLLVDYSDLCNYGGGSVVPQVIRRVVDGYGRELTSGQPGRLDFEDFVYFCLSEEDKNSEPAVFYWFKVLDVDGDGILSGYELNEFYRENRQRFLEYSESPEGDISYEDTMCQMLDMLGFDRIRTRKFGVTLGDLRACPTPANFFNMVFNAPKFMLFEHRDPFAEHQQKLRPEKTEWDRFARAEYDRMAAEAQ